MKRPARGNFLKSILALLAFSLAPRALAQTCCVDGNGIVNAFAGTGSTGYTGDGGPAALATFGFPYGLCIDLADNLYVCDAMNNAVRKITPAGIITTVAGTGAQGYSGDGGLATSATLNYPTFLCADPSGNLYICDSNNFVVRKVSAAGIITTFAGTGTQGYSGDGGPAINAKLNTPYGITIDSAGNVIITDSLGFRIRRVDTFGIITTIGGTGVAGYSGNGGPATNAKLNYPEGALFDCNDNLYFNNDFDYYIRKITPAGIISTFAGIGTGGNTGNGGPANLAEVDEEEGLAYCGGNIYLASWVNHTIRRVDPTGIITLVGGNGTASDTGDGGSVSLATFNMPLGLAFDSGGNLYVTSLGGYRIRKISGVACVVPCITVTPTSTFGPTQDCGKITINKNLFQPSLGPVLIGVPTGCLTKKSALRIYNSAGEQVRKIDLPPGPLAPGILNLGWDGKNQKGDPCASGIYIIHFTTSMTTLVRRVVLVR